VPDEAPLDVAGRVVAAAAHDFNNHITAIALQTELALASLGADDEKLRRRLHGILGSCENARGLARSLFAFGGRRPLHPVPMDAAGALERLAGARLSVSVADAPLPVEVDARALDEALGQLVELAGDEDVAVSGHIDGDAVELRVSQPGLEIDDEAGRRFFEPFASEDAPLGPSAVYGFVRQSGGTIALESAPGGGAVVVVRLPRATA
jgi:signal transduction histidine kinase